MSLPSEFGVTVLFETIGTVAPSSSSPLYERDKTVAPVQRTVDRPEEAAEPRAVNAPESHVMCWDWRRSEFGLGL